MPSNIQNKTVELIAFFVMCTELGCSLIKVMVANPKTPASSTVLSFLNNRGGQPMPRSGKAKPVMKIGTAMAAIPKSNGFWLLAWNRLRQ